MVNVVFIIVNLEAGNIQIHRFRGNSNGQILYSYPHIHFNELRASHLASLLIRLANSKLSSIHFLLSHNHQIPTH